MHILGSVSWCESLCEVELSATNIVDVVAGEWGIERAKLLLRVCKVAASAERAPLFLEVVLAEGCLVAGVHLWEARVELRCVLLIVVHKHAY